MPTAKSSSKPHLELTKAARYNVLEKFCQLLKSESDFKERDRRDRITFAVSDVEYKLSESESSDQRMKSGSTIVTIETLVGNQDNLPRISRHNKILLGIGFDNMMQLPYWAEVGKFHEMVDKIYVSYRSLTQEEVAKTHEYVITQDDNENKPRLRFETTIPGFFKPENLQTVIEEFGLQVQQSLSKSKESVQLALNEKKDDSFYLKLPSIKIVGKHDDTSEIPGTSSSMMRYFIKKYINAETAELKEQYKQNIKKIIFGDRAVDDVDDDWDVLFNNTVRDYEINKQTLFPLKEGKDLQAEQAKDAEYERQYSELFQNKDGGARSKKTKRYKRGRKNSRNKTRKRYLTNKKRSNRRRNRTRH
jgi:nicotinic acid mononucleotide adenylyltransferase